VKSYHVIISRVVDRAYLLVARPLQDKSPGSGRHNVKSATILFGNCVGDRVLAGELSYGVLLYVCMYSIQYTYIASEDSGEPKPKT
jgi:hypothetical protein